MITVKEFTQIHKESWDENIGFFTQSYAWVETRKQLGYEVLTLGIYKGAVLLSCVMVLLKKIPYTDYTVGYIPRGDLYDDAVYEALKVYGQAHHICGFIFEPNVFEGITVPISSLLQKGARGQFAEWSPFIDLTVPYDQIEAQFSKTVRNEARFALKNGLSLKSGTQDFLLQDFLKVMKTSTIRNGYTGYSEEYYTTVFKTLSLYDQARIFVAYTKDNKPVGVAMVFLFKDMATYAYAGSLGRETPKGAMYALVSEIIQSVQKEGYHTFDLFGSLSSEYTGSHPWSGFTQFKKSFGPEFKKYIGTYELVVVQKMYTVYRILSYVRRALTFIRKKVS